MSKFIERIPTAIGETVPYSSLTVEPLSKREQEVLHWVASGASNREIGQQLRTGGCLEP